jgi:hypothetical protein
MDAQTVLRHQAEREIVRRRVFRDKDIPYLISLMSALDQRTGERFTFEHIRDPLEPGEVWLEGNKLRVRDKNWRWQRWIVDSLLEHQRTIHLKGRQIGDTWIHVAVDVAEAILMPGTVSLFFRQKEDEAVDNIRRWWILFNSLPPWLLEKVPAGDKVGPITINKPQAGKADRPGRDGIALRFANGAFSEIVPMTSAGSSGHGRTVRRVNCDEAAHIEQLLSIRAAIEPAAGKFGKVNQVSTANGRSNLETGDGNEFHRLWTQAEDVGYHRVFLPFDLHPERDERWYDEEPEVQSLPIWKRQEQFPRDEHEAFALSDRSFFDQEALHDYGERIAPLLRRYDFVPAGPSRVEIKESDSGRIREFSKPNTGHSYAIGVDVATGRGADYSAAYVVDLTNAELVCEYHARVEADVYARDLHFLGRRYGTALLAIEVGGGYGDAVIIALRDGAAGRRPYPKLYRHVLSSRPDKPISKPFGFPTNTKTRPLILNQLERHLRERTLPCVSNDLLHEMSEFVYHDHGTSPRARAGSHDDRVMAAAIALEMYRLYGDIGGKRRTERRKSSRPKPAYPWQTAVA